MATIVFSHGFGTQADARGMFTDIIAAFPEHAFVTFNYNRVFDNGDVEVTSLDEQAQKLQQTVAEQQGDVIIIAHSQGCVVAGLINLQNVTKAILLAPPANMSTQRVIDKLTNKPGAEINLEGMSKLPRRDGTITHIPKAYLDSIASVTPLDLYQKIAENVDTTIVRCTDDEVLGLTNVDTVPHAKHIDITSDHDFTGEARNRLIALLANEL